MRCCTYRYAALYTALYSIIGAPHTLCVLAVCTGSVEKMWANSYEWADNENNK